MDLACGRDRLKYPVARRGASLVRPTSSLSERSAFALLLWALPTNVAFSRFGRYTTQSCLACYITLVLASRDSLARAATAMFIALLVHPTNIFILPMVFCLMLETHDGRGTCPGLSRGHHCWVSHRTRSWFGSLALACAQLVAQAGLKRLTDASEMQLFGERLVQFLSGTCVYRYLGRIELPASFSDGRDPLDDTVSDKLPVTWIAWVIAQSDRSSPRSCCDAWLPVERCWFYLVAATMRSNRFHERYALCLIPVIAGADGTDQPCLARASPLCSTAWFISVVPCVRTRFPHAVPGSFGNQGHNNHESFRAYRADPKWAAFEAIQAWRVRQSTNLRPTKN